MERIIVKEKANIILKRLKKLIIVFLKGDNRSFTLAIILGTIVPFIVISLVIIAIVCCCCRRKSKQIINIINRLITKKNN